VIQDRSVQQVQQVSPDQKVIQVMTDLPDLMVLPDQRVILVLLDHLVQPVRKVILVQLDQ
jgi:hypothetical protein